MSERLEALEGGLSEAASELAMWRGLMEHPGWETFIKTLKEEETMRALLVTRKRLYNFGESLAQEYMKGEANGLSFALAYPATKVEELTIEIRKLEVEIEGEHDVRKAERIDAGDRVPSDDGSIPSTGSST